MNKEVYKALFSLFLPMVASGEEVMTSGSHAGENGFDPSAKRSEDFESVATLKRRNTSKRLSVDDIYMLPLTLYYGG